MGKIILITSIKGKIMTRQFTVFTALIVILGCICGCKPEQRADTTKIPPVNVTVVDVNIEPEPIVPESQLLETKEVKAKELKAKQLEPEPVKPEPVEAEAVKPEPKPAEPIVSFHEKCSAVLSTYVSDKGKVNYKKLGLNREELRRLLSAFAGLDHKEYTSWSKEDKIAFWVNAYNLFTLKIIIDHYPIKANPFKTIIYPANSIMQIPDVWNKYTLPVMGVRYTLREIERNILLREFDDVRICFALTYASTSSPVLRNEPYTGVSLDKQLNEQVKIFLASPYGFKIDRIKRRVYLSVIFKWYAENFINKYGTDKKFEGKNGIVRAALNFISSFVSREDADFLARKNYSVEFMNYDWTLNE